MDNSDPSEYVVTAAAKKGGKILIERTKSVNAYGYSRKPAVQSIFDSSATTALKRKASTGAKTKDTHVHIQLPVKDLKLILPHLTIDLSDPTCYALLSKIGIRKFEDLYKAKNTFFKSMGKTQLAAFIDPAFMKKMIAEFPKKNKIEVSTAERQVTTVRKTDPKNGRARFVRAVKIKTTVKPLTIAANAVLAETLVKLYAVYANRLCSALGKDYEKYGQPIISRSILGKPIGGKLPAGFKDSFKASAKLKLNSGLKIEKLKPKDFKGASGQALVNALPQMYLDYFQNSSDKKQANAELEKLTERLKKVKSEYRAARRTHRQNGTSYSSKTRKLRDEVWTTESKIRELKRDKVSKNSKKKETPRTKANEKLFKSVGAEVYSFYRMVIPALKSPLASPFLSEGTSKKKSPKEIARLLRGMRWKLTRSTTTTAAKKKLKEQIAELMQSRKDAIQNEKPVVKTWMIPYLGADVAVDSGTKGKGSRATLDSGLLSHRLVTRANTGKLKSNDIELTVELDKNNALMLTLGGVAKILTACGSSLTAFKTVFKNVDKQVRGKAFVGEYSERSIGALETDTGKVSNSRLLRLNNVTQEEEAALEKDFAKEIKAWNPLKEELSKYISSLDKSKDAKAQHFTVTKSSSAELAANRKMIKNFFSFTHGVKELRINKSWEVSPSKKQLTILKNAANGAKLKVIQNVFHGTPRQAGSIILARGFKLAGTQVTARSMGDVLYIAANIDKSAQYIRSGGAFGVGKATGMIFMGDCIVSGEPKRKIAGGSNTGFAWTKRGDFKTEEIGLTNPNSQFIIRKAMIVTMDKTVKSTPRRAVLRGRVGLTTAPNTPLDVKGITKFETPIPLKSYNATKAPTSGEMKPKKVSKKDVESKVVKAPASKAKPSAKKAKKN